LNSLLFFLYKLFAKQIWQQSYGLHLSDEAIVADNRLSIVFCSSTPIIDFICHNQLSTKKIKHPTKSNNFYFKSDVSLA
jgi:hypothetical protein